MKEILEMFSLEIDLFQFGWDSRSICNSLPELAGRSLFVFLQGRQSPANSNATFVGQIKIFIRNTNRSGMWKVNTT